MSLVKNICKDMIEQYKKDQINNVKFDGPLSPILTTMIPLKVSYYLKKNNCFFFYIHKISYNNNKINIYLLNKSNLL